MRYLRIISAPNITCVKRFSFLIELTIEWLRTQVGLGACVVTMNSQNALTLLIVSTGVMLETSPLPGGR